MAYFPMFIDLEGEECLIVGGGKIAFRKVEVLEAFGLVITVAAKEICEEILGFADKNEKIQCLKMEVDAKNLPLLTAGKKMVIAATDDMVKNHEISLFCRKTGILVNAVDMQEDCDFIFPSYIKEGNVVGAFSSGGRSPLVTQYLKKCMEAYMTEFLGELTEYLGSIRKIVQKEVQIYKCRRDVYQALFLQGMETQKIPDESDLWREIQRVQSDEEK